MSDPIPSFYESENLGSGWELCTVIPGDGGSDPCPILRGHRLPWPLPSSVPK